MILIEEIFSGLKKQETIVAWDVTMNIPMCRIHSNTMDLQCHSNFVREEKICKDRKFIHIEQNLTF